MSAGRFADGLEERAAGVLPEAVFRYFRQGSRDSTSTAEAVAAWERHRFLPQVLRDVTRVDLRTTVLGTELASPFGVAPTAMQRAVHPEGEVAMARGIAAAGSLMVVSSNSGSTFEDDRRDRGHLLGPGVRHGRPARVPAAPAPRRRGRGPGGGADRRHPRRRHEARR